MWQHLACNHHHSSCLLCLSLTVPLCYCCLVPNQELSGDAHDWVERDALVHAAMEKFRLTIRSRPDFDRGCYNLGTVFYTFAMALQGEAAGERGGRGTHVYVRKGGGWARTHMLGRGNAAGSADRQTVTGSLPPPQTQHSRSVMMAPLELLII